MSSINPTPTQEEIDLAATGQHVVEKEADGSPPEGGPPPEQPPEPEPKEPEPKKLEPEFELEPEEPEAESKSYEALPNPGYKTRDY